MTSPVAKIADELEAKAAAFVKEHRLPGAAVGVVHGDDLVWSAGVGFADVASRRPPETSTLYRIASITKTFTGTAIMQLRDEGRLHLDDPIVAFVPELRDATSPFGPIETVTIRRMLSHESGLAGDPPGTDWSTPPVYQGLIASNLERVGEIGTRIPPNAQQKYSNMAYQLLGEVVTRVTGVSYVDHVRSAILEPLGMTNTHFEPVPHEALPRRARATTRGGSPTSSPWPTCRSRSGPRAASGRASRTWRGGSRSSSARTVDRATARRCWRVPR